MSDLEVLYSYIICALTGRTKANKVKINNQVRLQSLSALYPCDPRIRRAILAHVEARKRRVRGHQQGRVAVGVESVPAPAAQRRCGSRPRSCPASEHVPWAAFKDVLLRQRLWREEGGNTHTTGET